LKASGRPTVYRSFSVEDVRTSEQHRPNARSSCSKFYTELDFSRHCLGSFLQQVRTLPSIPKYFRFPLRTRKGVTVKTVRTLGQAVWTYTYYGKNCAILERRLQKTIQTMLTSVRTPTRQSLILSRIWFYVSL